MDPPAGRARELPVPEVGLTVIVEPDLPSLDVVFVHGFTGYPDKTWTHPQGTPCHRTDDGDEPPPKVRKLQLPFRSPSNAPASTSAVFWPRDLLPETLPNARVLTYGYDTHLRHKIFGRPINKLTLYDFANDLLVSMEAGRRGDPSRSLLFVCHSLGGVVVKEMLRQAFQCQDPDLRTVFESTIGMMFFGTPHSGADPRDLLHHVVEKFARVGGLSVNEQVVSALLPTSERLRQLRDEFNPIALKQEWGIHSFQESCGVRALGNNLVVNNMSSYLGLGHPEITEHINKNHMEMCRFANIDDPDYAKVVAALRRLTSETASRSTKDGRGHDGLSQPLSVTQRQALLQSLRFSQIDSRLGSVKAAHAKTCSWFLELAEYLDWLDVRKLDDHHGFFWIRGKPGAGKSTLMKYVLSKYQRRFKNTISFFFNARGAEIERTTVGMYRSLLLQLMVSQPHLQHAFDAAGLATWNATDDYIWTVEPLKRVFEEVVHLLRPSDSLACLIDALDECLDDEIRDMVEFFEDLGDYAVANKISFRVLFSSRHYPRITISKGLGMVLEKREEHSEDIRKFVESRLKIHAKHIKFRDEIVARIQEKASGVFMWVVLVVNMLNKSHDEGRPTGYIRKKLEALPSDLSELFRDMLMRDQNDRDEMLLCLQWILFARCPLKPTELYCAIHTGTEQESLAALDLYDDQAELFILNASKGLVEVITTKAKSKVKSDPGTDTEAKLDTRTVQFIHESVRDFLLKEGGLRTLWPHLGDAFEAQSHDRLKECCLKYINMPEVQKLVPSAPKVDESDATELPLLIHATQSGACHAEVAAALSPPSVAESDAMELPLLEYATQNVLIHADVAAAKGISQEVFLRQFPRLRWLTLHNRFAQYKSRRYSQTVTLLYVLADNNMGALIPVQASISGQTGLEVEEERFGPPLFAALATKSHNATLAVLRTIAQAHDSAPELNQLCDQFQQSRSSGMWGRNKSFSRQRGLIFHAVQELDVLILRFLLTSDRFVPLSLYGIQPEKQLRWAPLAYAVTCGWEPGVKILVEADIDIEMQDNRGQTPLGLAAIFGHSISIVGILVAAGAHIEARGKEGRTPLGLAADNGHASIVKKLVEAGANIDAKDTLQRTPLSLAASRGHESVVRILLEAGAHIETQDKNGWTPLIWAAHRGRIDVVQLLIRKGAQLEAKGHGGETALSLAAGSCMPGKEHVVRCLIEAGADILTTDNLGRTPQDWAIVAANQGVVDVLQAAARL